MKVKLIAVCVLAIFAAAGCKSTTNTTAAADTSVKNKASQQEERCSQNTGSRLKKKC